MTVWRDEWDDDWDGSFIGIGWNKWEEFKDAPELEYGPTPPTAWELADHDD